MRINAVSSFNYNAQRNHQNQNFTGVITGIGKLRNPGGQANYAAVIYNSFNDGVQVSGGVTPGGRRIIEGRSSELSKNEGKLVLDFLEGKNTAEGYKAAKEFRKFIIDTKMPNGTNKHHNAVFIDPEEGGILNLDSCKRVNLAKLEQKISTYEQSHGIISEEVIQAAAAATGKTTGKPWLKVGADGKPIKIDPATLGQLTEWIKEGYMPDSDTLLGLLQSHGVA
jgi:hypothetical protein